MKYFILLLALVSPLASGYEYYDALDGRKWRNNQVVWHYNPAHSPFGNQEVVDTINRAMAHIESKIGIKFVYGGITNRLEGDLSDGLYTIGWSFQCVGAGFLSVACTQSRAVGDYMYDAKISLRPMLLEDSYRNLLGTMTHEILHTLGIAHSKDPSSIMHSDPYNTLEYQETLRLDDIKGLSLLYPVELVRPLDVSITIRDDGDLYIPSLNIDGQYLWILLTLVEDGVWVLGDFDDVDVEGFTLLNEPTFDGRYIRGNGIHLEYDNGKLLRID